MLIKDEETFAMIWKAVVERTMEVSSDEGLETEDCALSTILIWMVWPGIQVLGTAALIHLTSYNLPHAAPLSHIPSPAEPNMLLDGNCDASPPKHAVAVLSRSTKHNKFVIYELIIYFQAYILYRCFSGKNRWVSRERLFSF